MNLTQFMSRTDRITRTCTREQLERFVHEAARALPGERRDSFTAMLESAAGIPSSASVPVPSREELEKSTQQTKKRLEEIREEDLRLTRYENEEYRYSGHWDPDEEEAYYKDRDHIMDRVEEACTLIHTLVGAGSFDLALTLGRALLNVKPLLHVVGRGDLYEEGDEFSLSHAVSSLEASIDLQSAGMDIMYAACRSLVNPAPELIEMICSDQFDSLSLEGFLQYVPEEIRDPDPLLTAIADLLVSESDWRKKKLYQEAYGLLSSEAKAELARRHFDQHPENLSDALDCGDLPAETLFELGQFGLERLTEGTGLYTSTALKTAGLALSLRNDSETAEKYRLQAFRSDLTAENYLRALLNSGDREKTHAELHSILADRDPEDSRSILAVRFFDGDFRRAFEKGLHPKDYLGWKGSFMREGFALFLATLYQGEAYPPGLAAVMAKCPDALCFNPSTYGLSLPEGTPCDFQDCFLQWKSGVTWPADLPAAEVLDHFEEVMRSRIRAITEIRSVRSYPECASIVAAIGEVRESLGEKGAKQRVLGEYAKTYSRFRSLRTELKNFGWNA